MVFPYDRGPSMSEPEKQIESASSTVDMPDDVISLPDGKSLNLQEASEFFRIEDALLFVLAGPHESGKTTVLATLWELILKGNFGNLLFAGSKTIPGFEKRCFDSRVSSGRKVPTTQHTLLSEDPILHLRMRKSDLKVRAINLLFSDLAGERYRLAKDSLIEAKKLILIPRSDHFMLLVDGAKIVDKSKRQETFADTRLILRSFLDSGMLNKHSFVDVIFSKWDLVDLNIRAGGGADKFVEVIEDDLKIDFENRVGQLAFFKIAARPVDNSKLHLGHNLFTTIQFMMEHTPTREYIVSNNPSCKATREIDRFFLS